MSNLEKIPVFFLKLESLNKLYINQENMLLDNIGIVINNKRTILCQILYKEKELIRTPYSLKVNKNSLIPYRKMLLNYMVENSIKKYQLGLTASSINGINSNIINFIDWLNDNNLELNENINNAAHILSEYIVFLKSRIRDSTLCNSNVCRKQTDVYKMLCSVYDDRNNTLGRSANFINRDSNKFIKTEKNSQEDQKYHYEFHYNLFHQIADFILNEESFPLKFNLLNKEYWCLPSQKMFFKMTDKNYPHAFNIKTGNIKVVEEIMKEYNSSYNDANAQHKNFIQHLAIANKCQSKRKLFLASYGLQAFYILFLTNTGMNDSVAATLKWSDDYEVEQERYRFKNIKYRANNKLVEFEIGSKFVKDFQKYIKLRKYLLCDKKFDYLFFIKSGISATLSIMQKDGTFSSILNRRFKKILDSKLPIITSRQLRVNKTYQTIEKHGVITASQLAQTSINTLLKHYQGTSSELVEEEFEKYFITLNNTLFTDKEGDETTVGWCNNPTNPKQTLLPDILTGCENKEGCLFCENYRLHIDEYDINKLFSLKYVINECRYVAKNEEHFNSIYGGILKRLNNIFGLIKEHKRDIDLELLEKNVFEKELLHPYWEHKLNTLISMGAL